MKSYNVKIVMPDNYVHCLCFSEIKLGLDSALKELNMYSENGRSIVLGAHVVQSLPENAIIFNLEQISQESSWMTINYLNLLRSHEVWDYSEQNIFELEKLGVKAKLCRIGYVPELTKIIPAEELDIDVLFYGSLNNRRINILQEIGKYCHVATVPGYGEQRDKVIARSKIIINLHYYESKVFELVRCSYLMANKKCVVSEIGLDLALEKPFEDAMVFAPYENLAGACLEILGSEAWKEVGEKGFDVFSKMKQLDYLKAVL